MLGAGNIGPGAKVWILIRLCDSEVGARSIDSTDGITEIIVLDACSNDWISLLPKDDEILSRELTRLMLAYWDIDQKKAK